MLHPLVWPGLPRFARYFGPALRTVNIQFLTKAFIEFTRVWLTVFALFKYLEIFAYNIFISKKTDKS